jgi:hypothetical protein
MSKRSNRNAGTQRESGNASLPLEPPVPQELLAGSALPMAGVEDDVLHLEDLESTLIGAGRAGSMIALVLLMLGVRVRAYDGDRLGPENQGLQLYRKDDIQAGRLKVEALGSLLRELVPGGRFQSHAEFYEARGEQRRSPIVVLAVDRMDTRARLWEALKNMPGVERVLDVRLGRGLVRLHEVSPSDPDEVEAYEASLYDDETAAADDCTDAGTTHAAAAAAALIGGALRAYVEDLPRPRWIGVDLDRALWASG